MRNNIFKPSKDIEDLAIVAWQDNFFKYCEFIDLKLPGASINSDFIKCTFNNINMDEGIFDSSSFIGTNFESCTFNMVGFADCIFTECLFVQCTFISDSDEQYIDEYFEGSKFYETKFFNCSGISNENT